MLVSTIRPMVNGKSDSREKYLMLSERLALRERKIVLGQVIDDLPRLGPYRRQDIHYLHVGGEGGLVLARNASRNQQQKSRTGEQLGARRSASLPELSHPGRTLEMCWYFASFGTCAVPAH